MTDTAVPMPEPIDADAVTDGAILRPSQLRRIEALQAARNVLVSKPLLFSGSGVPESRSVGDLVYLADWILFGSDPDDEAPSSGIEDLANIRWARRQGYVEGVRSAATLSDAGGDGDKIRSMLDDDEPPSLRAMLQDALDDVDGN